MLVLAPTMPTNAFWVLKKAEGLHAKDQQWQVSRQQGCTHTESSNQSKAAEKQ
jgi:hypothetical protein